MKPSPQVAIASMAREDAGNRTGPTRDGVLTTWTYDTAYRLMGQQTSGGWATFTYDGAGNMTFKAHHGSSPMTLSYDAANRITTIAQGTGAGSLTTVTFDANGNLTVEQVDSSRTSYVYDHENRLINVLFADGTRSTYTHDGLGLRRSAFEAGGSLTSVIWDGAQYLMEKTAASTVRYVSAEGELLAEKRGANRRWYVPDLIGSAIAMLDSAQTQTDSFSYWPYGEDLTRTGTTATPFRFLGTWSHYSDSSRRLTCASHTADLRMGRRLTPAANRSVTRYAYAPPAAYPPSGLTAKDAGTQEDLHYIRLNCRGLNPNTYQEKCLGGAEPCQQCCTALAEHAKISVLITCFEAALPGPTKLPTTNLPTGRVFNCAEKCQTECRKKESGSIAILTYFTCLYLGVYEDGLIALAAGHLARALIRGDFRNFGP